MDGWSIASMIRGRSPRTPLASQVASCDARRKARATSSASGASSSGRPRNSLEGQCHGLDVVLARIAHEADERAGIDAADRKTPTGTSATRWCRTLSRRAWRTSSATFA